MSLNKLHPRLQDHVKNQKWNDLTEIQKQAFDPIYTGKSCIIEAPTSGGKTEAVLFPLLTRISTARSDGFKILYIAPLKALLNDLALRVVPYAKMCYKEAFKWHGDVEQSDKIQQMLFPSDILLTTPESIEAIMLRRSNWKNVFASLETIVIDEAHYFALTDRGSHLIALLERIVTGIGRQPQRIAVTATIGNPEQLLQWLMSNRQGGLAIRVQSGEQKERDFKIKHYNDDGAGLFGDLYGMLSRFKDKNDRVKSIVFERSRTGTENTATKINERNVISQTKFPVKVKTHHSSVSKRLREEAEASIKQKRESSIDAIISTSTLELGIDIGDLDQVIQVGGLNSSGAFLQRVGRTGRRKDKPQYFRGLVTNEDELLLLIGCVSLGVQRISENILFPSKAFHILAHQLICLCLQHAGVIEDQVWNILSKASCFSGINREEFKTLVSFMVQEDFLRRVDRDTLLTGSKAESEFLRANWKRLFAIFESGPMYNVVDGKKIIGTLDSGFAMLQQLPFVFVLGGQEWNAVKIDHEMQQVLVQKNDTGEAPTWTSIGQYDIPFELAQEVGRLLMNNEEPSFLDSSVIRVLQRQRESHFDLQWKRNKWILESSEEFNRIYIWTFGGDKINRTLAKLISATTNKETRLDYMKVIIVFGKEDSVLVSDVYTLLSSLHALSTSEVEKTLEEHIEPKWFSKFSQCLPPELSKKTILEKSMDVNGLCRQMTTVSFDSIS